MTAKMTNEQVVATVGDLLEVLRQPDRDPMLIAILESLPLTSDTLIKVLTVLSSRAGQMTLEAAGVDPRNMTGRVRPQYALPADDMSDHAKTGATLLGLGCNFLLAEGAAAEMEAASSLDAAVTTAVARGPQHTFLVLGEILGHIRRLIDGDTRGVIRA
ncbi:hypothetical protein [Promicromonospora sp. NPDC023805]|uniref:hypothetical protein n=1 Tax=Promicromonospora sp. NPDC023805 TaxID=3154696 RepID=UPI0033DD6CEA